MRKLSFSARSPLAVVSTFLVILRARSAPFADDVVEKHLLFVAGDVVFVKAGGFVEFFTQNIHRGAVDGVVFVDRIGHDTGIGELFHFAARLHDDVCRIGRVNIRRRPI